MHDKGIIARILRKFPAKIEAAKLPLPATYLEPSEVYELEFIKEGLHKMMTRLPEAKKNDLIDDFMHRFIFNSIKLDGNTLSKADVKRVIDGKSISRKTLETIEVVNLKAAFNTGLKYKGELCIEFLKEMHGIIMKSIDSHAGNIRDHDVEIYGSEYMPPGHEMVELELERLFEEVKDTSLHIFEASAIFHMRLVSIHPFHDGNGRVGQLMHNLMLWRESMPMIIFPASRKKEYFSSLEECHLTNSARAFIDFMKKIYL